MKVKDERERRQAIAHLYAILNDGVPMTSAEEELLAPYLRSEISVGELAPRVRAYYARLHSADCSVQHAIRVGTK